MVQRVPSKHCPGQIERLEPVILDLSKRWAIAGVDVQAEGDALRADAQRGLQEVNEEADHREIRIHEADRVSVLRALRPVQKAAGHVERIGLAGPNSPFTLKLEPLFLTTSSPRGAPSSGELRVLWTARPTKVSFNLVGRELDVARPVEDARRRHIQACRDLLDRHSLLSQLTRFLPLSGLSGPSAPYEHTFVKVRPGPDGMREPPNDRRCLHWPWPGPVV